MLAADAVAFAEDAGTVAINRPGDLLAGSRAAGWRASGVMVALKSSRGLIWATRLWVICAAVSTKATKSAGGSVGSSSSTASGGVVCIGIASVASVASVVFPFFSRRLSLVFFLSLRGEEATEATEAMVSADRYFPYPTVLASPSRTILPSSVLTVLGCLPSASATCLGDIGSALALRRARISARSLENKSVPLSRPRSPVCCKKAQQGLTDFCKQGILSAYPSGWHTFV
jgi:hypothetical protein